MITMRSALAWFRRPASIGTTLLAIAGALTAMVALLATQRIAEGVARHQDVARLEAVNTVIDDLLQACETLAFERDLTLAVLAEPHGENAEDLRLAARAARERAIAAHEAAMAGVNADPTLYPWSERMAERARVIGVLRAETDRLFEGDDVGAGAAAANWMAGVEGYIDEADALWLELVRPYGGIDTTAAQQIRYMHFLSAIYDYSGRERSHVTQILAGSEGRATPFELAQLNHAQGVLDVSWRAARDLAVQGDFYESVGGAFVDAKSHYDTLHGMLRETFYAPQANGAGLPMSPALWLVLSEQYSDSLDQLRMTSRTTLRDHLTALRADAVSAMTVQIGVLVIAMVLCGLCALVVSRAVVQPINAIVKALVSASRGERFAIADDVRARRDEIGQLAEVLHVFERQVEIVRKTAAERDAGERRLRAILDNTADGLITIDEKGAIETFNPASERLFGYATGEATGGHISALMPGLFYGIAQTTPREARTDAPTVQFDLTAASAVETTGVRKDGSTVPIELTLSEINLANASLLCAIVRDISPRKAAEAQILAHTNALERSNRELDDFAYIASHDLKEPLRGLHNHARFLLEDNHDKLDDESVRRLNRLVALTQRMERLVNDLLYFSRLGRQELAVHATDLSNVVRDIEGTLDHFLEENGARIVMPEPLPTTICDATRVSELFRNLITNAVKYNDKPDRIVEIGVAHAEASSHGAAKTAPVFYVRDNGAGIPAEFHQEVFRIFKRLNNHATPSDGTGVGLTFVKKIVERHGGEIWIESAPGEGATFFFTLEPSYDERPARAA